MATDVGTLVVNTKVDTSGVVRGFAEVRNQVKSVTSQIGLISSTVRSTFSSLASLKNVIIGSFAIGAIKSAVNTYAQAQAAQEGLASAIRATGGSVASLMPNLQRLQADIQRLTIYEDDAVASVQTLGIAMGISADSIGDATKAAVGLSGLLGRDLESSMQLVARAMQGDYEMLQRYLPELKTMQTDTEKLDYLNRKLAEGMEMAKDKVKTAAGAWMQFQNVMGDVWEAVGNGIVDGIAGINGFKDSSQSLVQFLGSDQFKGRITEVFRQITGVIGNLSIALVDSFRAYVDFSKAVAGSYGILFGVAAIFAAINAKATLMAFGFFTAAGGLRALQAAAGQDMAEAADADARMAQRRMQQAQERIAAADQLYASGGMNRAEYAQYVSRQRGEIARQQVYARQNEATRNDEYRAATEAVQSGERILSALEQGASGLGNISEEIEKAIAEGRNYAATSTNSLSVNPLRPGQRPSGEDGAGGQGGGGSEQEAARAAADLVRLQNEVYLDGIADRYARERKEAELSRNIEMDEFKGTEEERAQYMELRQRKYLQQVAAINEEERKAREEADRQFAEIAQAGAQQVADVRRDVALASIFDEFERRREEVRTSTDDAITQFKREQQERMSSETLTADQRKALEDQTSAYVVAIREREAQQIEVINREQLNKNAEITAEFLRGLQQEQSKSIGDRYNDMLEQIRMQTGATGEYFSQMTGNITSSFSGAMETLMNRTASFKDAFSDMITNIRQAFNKMVADMVAQWAVLQIKGMFSGPSIYGPTQDGGNLADGASTGFSIASLIASIFAKGGAFQGGRMIKMATGGIVTGPTVFPMANGMGLMGEAGPEAVMPLKRTAGGKLGIIAQGATPTIINNYSINGSAVDRSQFDQYLVQHQPTLYGLMQQNAARGGVMSGLAGA